MSGLHASIRQPRRAREAQSVWPAILLGLMGLGLAAASARAETHPRTIHFGRDIQPILADRCFKCHGPDAKQRQAGLRLDGRELLTAEGESGLPTFVPGQPQQSAMYQRITHKESEERMPPEDEGEPLTAEEIERIRIWIEQGAPITPHWAFVAPKPPAIPEVAQESWPRGEIDHFVLAQLEKARLVPAPQASRRTLIRRLSLDLLGLPPTVDEVEVFVRDDSADAYERLVERMLHSPHYGERMAQDWLDLARYADTTGFATDRPRPMWLYRDWVIHALNNNMPFDQFTIAQLAGDMLPDPSAEDRLATGFHRSSMQALGNNPPKEEFRVKGIIDRVNTTGRVWLGLTFSCAECHDHKFDPITQHDYYRLYALFNNIPHDGENFEVQGPRTKACSPLAPLRREQIEQELSSLRKEIPAATAEAWARRQQSWEADVAKLLATKPTTPLAQQGGSRAQDTLVAHWPLEHDLLDRAAAPVTLDLRAAQATWAEKPKDTAVAEPAKVALKLAPGEYLRGGGCEKFRLPGDLTLSARIQTTASKADIICKYDSERAARAFVFGIGGEGEANAKPGTLYAWVSRSPERLEGVQIYGSIPVNDGKPHHVALVLRAGKSIELYVDGQRDAASQRVGEVPETVADADCDLLLGAGYGLKEDEKSYFLDGLLWDVRMYQAALPAAAELGLLPSSILALLPKSASERSRGEEAALTEFFRSIDRTDVPADLASQIDQLTQELASLSRPTEAQVMLEMEEPRKTHIHIRGDFTQLGEPVKPAVPEFLQNPPDAAVPDRLTLARWLVNPENPLTARVAVNRFWQHYFGIGLVATADDFGLQGAWPSHPALLDWLAIAFMQSGWDMKQMHRLIVTSATYRQSSARSPDQYQRDPENRLLARGPRFRLAAEQIRDNALTISGLLYEKLGGPSIYPPQPAGLFEEKGQLQYHPTWITSVGRDAYRRGIYVYWKRMNLYPSLATFGAPTRERCTVRRPQSNTPLQALVLLNDPVYLEAARHFADQVLSQDAGGQLDYAMRRCLSRPPTSEERNRYTQFLNRQIERYRQHQDEARQLLNEEETPGEPTAELAGRAAWTLLANVLLNLDETMSKQ